MDFERDDLSESAPPSAGVAGGDGWDGLREALRESESHLSEGDTRLIKEATEGAVSLVDRVREFRVDPTDKLSYSTKRRWERRLAKSLGRKKKKLDPRVKRRRRREKTFRERDAWSRWEAYRGYYWRDWDLSFDDWLDILEFVRIKWDRRLEKEGDGWGIKFRRREGRMLTLETTLVEDVKEGGILFYPEEFKMWKEGYLSLD